MKCFRIARSAALASLGAAALALGAAACEGRAKVIVQDDRFAQDASSAAECLLQCSLDGRSVLPFARNVRLRSLRPFLHTTSGQGARGHINTREGGAKGTQPRVPAWSAVRTTRWLYVEYKGGWRELFDLSHDRWELRSRVLDPRIRTRMKTLRRILGDLRTCKGASCSRIADASVR